VFKATFHHDFLPLAPPRRPHLCGAQSGSPPGFLEWRGRPTAGARDARSRPLPPWYRCTQPRSAGWGPRSCNMALRARSVWPQPLPPLPCQFSSGQSFHGSSLSHASWLSPIWARAFVRHSESTYFLLCSFFFKSQLTWAITCFLFWQRCLDNFARSLTMSS
jgi:hypothetical protein